MAACNAASRSAATKASPGVAVPEGETKGSTNKTDAEGKVSFHLDKNGRWLLRGTDLRKSTKKDVYWESDFATLTIQVSGR